MVHTLSISSMRRELITMQSCLNWLGCDRTPDHKSNKVPLITVLLLNLYLFTVATPFYPPTEKVLSDANDLSAAEY